MTNNGIHFLCGPSIYFNRLANEAGMTPEEFSKLTYAQKAKTLGLNEDELFWKADDITCGNPYNFSDLLWMLRSEEERKGLAE